MLCIVVVVVGRIMTNRCTVVAAICVYTIDECVADFDGVATSCVVVFSALFAV